MCLVAGAVRIRPKVGRGIEQGKPRVDTRRMLNREGRAHARGARKCGAAALHFRHSRRDTCRTCYLVRPIHTLGSPLFTGVHSRGRLDAPI